jgi:hypothetical protein
LKQAAQDQGSTVLWSVVYHFDANISRQQRVDDFPMDVRQAKVTPLETVGQACVVKAE